MCLAVKRNIYFRKHITRIGRKEKLMNAKSNMIIIKGEIKTPDIISCTYNVDTKKMDVIEK